jgi:hypothetical protein
MGFNSLYVHHEKQKNKMDKYQVLETIKGNTITWESQFFNNRRQAELLKKEKHKKTSNPDVVYLVKIMQPPGVSKSSIKILR